MILADTVNWETEVGRSGHDMLIVVSAEKLDAFSQININ